MASLRGTSFGAGMIAAITRLAVEKQLREDLAAGRLAVASDVATRHVAMIEPETGARAVIAGLYAEGVA